MERIKGLKYYDVQKIETIKELMELAVKDAGDKLAFRYPQKDQIIDVTYKEFQSDTISLGTAITDLGFESSHIAVIGENSYNWLTVYLTVLKSSGVLVPVDKELVKDDIINVIDNSDSEVLFYSGKFNQYIDEFKERLPKVKYYICFDNQEDNGNVLSYNLFKEKGRKLFENGNTKYLSLTNDPNELKLLVYTSGTTGLAKGVMLTEHNLVSCVRYGLEVSTVYDSCLSVLPYHHTYEAVAGILVGLHHHSTICINDSLKKVLKNLQTFKPEYVYLVPAFAEVFYKKIWATAKEGKKEFGLKVLIGVSNALRKIGIDVRKTLFKSVHLAFGGKLRKIVVGGAPLRKELGQFFDSIGISLVNGYGITECSPLVSANMDDFNDPATVGIPLTCCDIKIDNPADDGIGEICVKGDIVMLGYYKNPEKTAEVLKDGWFSTGDYGYVNKKGQLLITGRKKNLIVLKNGKNIFPEEIENYIMKIPYIQEVIVKSVKEDDGQENGLCAEVFLNSEKVKELGIPNEEIEKTLKKDISAITLKLAVYKHVTQVEIRDKEFDKTTTNKIKR